MNGFAQICWITRTNSRFFITISPSEKLNFSSKSFDYFLILIFILSHKSNHTILIKLVFFKYFFFFNLCFCTSCPYKLWNKMRLFTDWKMKHFVWIQKIMQIHAKKLRWVIQLKFQFLSVRKKIMHIVQMLEEDIFRKKLYSAFCLLLDKWDFSLQP